MKAYRFPDPTEPSRLQGLRERARSLSETTDYALVSGAMISVDYVRWTLRGLEEAVADLYEEPLLTAYLLDRIVEWMIAFGSAILEQIGPLARDYGRYPIDAARIGERIRELSGERLRKD